MGQGLEYDDCRHPLVGLVGPVALVAAVRLLALADQVVLVVLERLVDLELTVVLVHLPVDLEDSH